MVLDSFAFGVQQIIETNQKCLTNIIADNGSLSRVYLLRLTFHKRVHLGQSLFTPLFSLGHHFSLTRLIVFFTLHRLLIRTTHQPRHEHTWSQR